MLPVFSQNTEKPGILSMEKF